MNAKTSRKRLTKNSDLNGRGLLTILMVYLVYIKCIKERGNPKGVSFINDALRVTMFH